MITLHDIVHLPALETWFEQIAQEPNGLVVVAGPASEGPAGVLGMLCRQMLAATGPDGRPRRAVAVGRSRFVRPARDQALRLRYVCRQEPEIAAALESLRRAQPGQADLVILDDLRSETLGPALELAATGIAVLAPLDTVLVGSQVFGFLQELGAPDTLLTHVGWIVGVQRLPSVCRRCAVPWVPTEAELQALDLEPGEVGEAPLYCNEGCPACTGDAARRHVAAFDIFRHRADEGVPAGSWYRASDLPLREYALDLARGGHIPLAEVGGLERGALQRAQRMLFRQRRELARSEVELRARVAELEASQRVLLSSTQALISLQDVTQALAASSDRELADRILRYVRRIMEADLVALYLIEPDGSGQIAAHAGWKLDAEQGRIAASEIGGWLARVPAGGPLALPMEQLPPGVRRPGDRDGPRTGLALVLMAGEVPVGLLFAHSTVRRQFAAGERNVLKMFAHQAAVAVQRQRLVAELQAKIAALEQAQAEIVQKERLERELELAREIQQSFLPARFPHLAGVQLAARSVPARAVGGDFYDAFALPDGRLALIIGDVSDKGLPAALFMALTRSLVRAEAQREASPARVLANVNRLLLEMSDSAMFVTAFFGVLHPERRELVYARAGHERPLLVRAATHQCWPLPGEGAALGVLPSLKVDELAVALLPGDELVLFTDGYTDQVLPNGETYGHGRLRQGIEAHSGLDVEAQCAALFAELAAVQGPAEPFDDTAILLLRLEEQAQVASAVQAGNKKGEP